jgi:hypothetical protein
VLAPGDELESKIKLSFNAGLNKYEIVLPDVGLEYNAGLKKNEYVRQRLGVAEPLRLYVESEDDQADVTVEDESLGRLLLFDESINPEARYCETQDNETDLTCVRGSGTLLFNMTDNEVTSTKKYGDRRLAKWFHTLIVAVVSADGYTQQRYDVILTQLVSTTAVLKDLRVADDTPCELTPKFDPEVLEYTCRWNWDICANEPDSSKCSNNISIVPIADEERCPMCDIIMPDLAHIRKEDTLFMDMEAELESNPKSWETGREWRIPLLYGEEHTSVIRVLAADRLNYASYKVSYGIDAPCT